MQKLTVNMKKCRFRQGAFFRFSSGIAYCLLFIFLASCSLQKNIGTIAKKELLSVPELKTAHIGVCVYEPEAEKYWYSYEGDKYFIPASNTKLFTCYAMMKHLGDSLPGLQWTQTPAGLLLFPTADPSLLHPDFSHQPVIDFLQNRQLPLQISTEAWKSAALGSGWAWDDYNSSYMAERSALPVYGNLIRFVQTATEDSLSAGAGSQVAVYTIPEINWKLNFNPDTAGKTFSVERNRDDNIFTVTEGTEKYREQSLPFVTKGVKAALELLKDTTGKTISTTRLQRPPVTEMHTLFSQPTDSLLRLMMHRSDNFFAEQGLLMVSNVLLGAMDDRRITDTLLNLDFRELPQRPHWVDGSGLSRYNLFSPQDFTWLLTKMKKEFPWKRLTGILPTGNEGTLKNYYQSDSSFIYAKTGTLSGQVAISGFLITSRGKTLVFSVLVNNHRAGATLVRRAVEKFLEALRNRY